MTTTKICRLCEESKSIEEFYADRKSADRLRYECKECGNLLNRRFMRGGYEREYYIKRRQADPGYGIRPSKQIPDHVRARRALHYAVYRGRIIKPSRCSHCGESGVVICGHHDDYSKPLEVRWVCHRCHGILHRDPKLSEAIVDLEGRDCFGKIRRPSED